jgi:ABC-2 type transport system permease protein
MKAFLAILKIRMKVIFQYRAAAFAGVSTQFFWGVILVMIYRAFYENSDAPQPISLSQAISFIWIGQSLIQMIPWSIDKEIEEEVRNGNVAYALVRPIDMYGLWFARSFALRTVPTLMRFAPIFAFGGLFFGLSAPISLEAGIAFVISVFFALILSSAISSLILISLFWTVSGEGVQRLMPHFTLFFSGMIVPLPLFPSWMQPILNVQPFRGVMDIPCRLYTGVIPTSEALYYFGFQIIWALVFVLFGQWLLKRALKSFVIQGG